jgi:hypothetical protein
LWILQEAALARDAESLRGPSVVKQDLLRLFRRIHLVILHIREY